MFKMLFGNPKRAESIVLPLTGLHGRLKPVTPLLLPDDNPDKRSFETDLMFDLLNHADLTHRIAMISLDMQNKLHDYWGDRFAEYVWRMASRQLAKGAQWDKLVPAIAIVFANSVAWPNSPEYIHSPFTMSNTEGLTLSSVCQVYVVELPKVPRDSCDVLDVWLLFIGSLSRLDVFSVFMKKLQIQNSSIVLKRYG